MQSAAIAKAGRCESQTLRCALSFALLPGKKGRRRRSSPAVNPTRGDGAALNQLTDWDSVEAAFNRGRTGGSGSGFKWFPFLVGCYANS
ncbi:hypothetical protein NL676_027546 [Syzygium grande]|nr:hypothetical protein NL676_027546 [Syzygium grande]